MNDKLKQLLITRDFTVKDAMRFMSANGQKESFLVDRNKKLIGSLSDGDIRKWILKEGKLTTKAEKVCNKNPQCVGESFDIEHVKTLMLELKIDAIPVLNAHRQIQNILIWEDVFSGKVSRLKEPLKVPVVIMAGGKGTRLDPFTKILPKPLIPIGDKPVIELIMDKFYEYGVDRFYVSLNHKSRMIKSYFQETSSPYRIDYIQEETPLGTAGSLRTLENIKEQRLLVTNCDVIINSDYSELVKFHDEHCYDLTLVVSLRHHVIPYGVCDIMDGGTLKRIKEKPEYDLLVNTGMYVISKKVLRLIPKNKFYNITDLIAKLKGRGLKVGAFPINESSWIDVGQWEEYQKAVKMLGV